MKVNAERTSAFAIKPMKTFPKPMVIEAAASLKV